MHSPKAESNPLLSTCLPQLTHVVQAVPGWVSFQALLAPALPLQDESLLALGCQPAPCFELSLVTQASCNVRRVGRDCLLASTGVAPGVSSHTNRNPRAGQQTQAVVNGTGGGACGGQAGFFLMTAVLWVGGGKLVLRGQAHFPFLLCGISVLPSFSQGAPGSVSFPPSFVSTLL